MTAHRHRGATRDHVTFSDFRSGLVHWLDNGTVACGMALTRKDLAKAIRALDPDTVNCHRCWEKVKTAMREVQP